MLRLWDSPPESYGMKVLRFKNTQVLKELDAVASAIVEALRPSP